MFDKLIGAFVTMMKSKALKPAEEYPKDEPENGLKEIGRAHV